MFAGVVSATGDGANASVSLAALAQGKDYYANFILNLINSNVRNIASEGSTTNATPFSYFDKPNFGVLHLDSGSIQFSKTANPAGVKFAPGTLTKNSVDIEITGLGADLKYGTASIPNFNRRIDTISAGRNHYENVQKASAKNIDIYLRGISVKV